MPATIDQFDFGLRANVIVPSREPSPDDHVAYTIFHVSRALDYHQTKGNTTIEPILNYFGPVSSLNYSSRCPTFHCVTRLTSSSNSRSSGRFSPCSAFAGASLSISAPNIPPSRTKPQRSCCTPSLPARKPSDAHHALRNRAAARSRCASPGMPSRPKEAASPVTTRALRSAT